MTTEATTQTWQWTLSGAWSGGTVLAVAAARPSQGPVRILAATRAGLICSDDLGASWSESASDMADPNVVAVTFAGEGHGQWPAAFAATGTGRLYRSDDGGVTWGEVQAWAGLGAATALCASPAFDDDGILFVGAPEGIFRTLDGGATWESCNFGLMDVEVLCLACAPDFATSQLLWAGTANGGLYRSRNQGRAWREAGIGLPDAAVQVLAAPPTFGEDATLYAGMEGQGLFCSTDRGETWSPCAPTLAGHSVNVLLALGHGRGLIAATDQGLFVSDAGGENWGEADAAQPAVLALAAADTTVVAGTYLGGVLMSGDGGHTWRTVETPPLHVPPLVTASGQRRYALDMDGAAAVSEDGGATWETLAPPDVDGLYALAAHPRPDNAPILASILAGTSAGLWSYDPEQEGWSPLEMPGLPKAPVLGVEWAADGGACLAYTAGGELYAHVDGDLQWQEITGPWQGQTLLRALPAQDESGNLRALALTLELNEQGHYAIHLWFYQAGAWANLANLFADIPAMLVAWPHADRIWLATQHRVVRIQWQGEEQRWEANQHFFMPGEQVTALDSEDNGETVWVATTQAIYCSLGPNTPWTQISALPDHQPVVFLRAQAGLVEAMTLGGRVWRGHPIA